MPNSFTSNIYNEINSDLNTPNYPNIVDKNISSVFLSQKGGSNKISNTDSDINNLLSMLTTETNVNTTQTDNLEKRLTNMMQKGGNNKTDNYSNLFLEANGSPSKEGDLSATSSVMPENNNFSQTSTVRQNGGGEMSTTSSVMLSTTSVRQRGGGGILSTTSSVGQRGGGEISATSSAIPNTNQMLSQTSTESTASNATSSMIPNSSAAMSETSVENNNFIDVASKAVSNAIKGFSKYF